MTDDDFSDEELEAMMSGVARLDCQGFSEDEMAVLKAAVDALLSSADSDDES